MKKRILSFLLASAMLLAMTACSGKTPGTSSSGSSQGDGSGTTSGTTSGALEEAVCIGDWGGAWNEMAKTCVYEPFNELYPDTQIISDFPGSSGAILSKLEAQKTNPQYDVALMTELMTIKAIRAGLLEEIDESDVPELSDVVDVAKMEGYGPAVLLGEVGIAYNPDMVEKVPTCWTDLADPSYKNMIAFPNISNTSAILFLCQIATLMGGSEADVQPGFEFIEGMLDNVKTTYGSDPDVQQLFEREEIAVAIWWNGPALSAKQNGLNVEYVRPSDGAPAVRSFINVVKGAPHPEAAKRMVAQYISEEAQTGVMEQINYGPTNVNVSVDPEKAAFIATGDDLDKLVNFDWGVIADQSAQWTETWNKMFGQ